MNLQIRILSVATMAIALVACQPSQTPDQSKPDAKTAPAEPAKSPAGDPMAMPDGMPGRADPGLPKRDTTVVDAKVVNVRLSDKGDTEKHTLGLPTTTFGPKDSVYAEIETQGTAKSYTLYAKWTAADGTVLSDYGMRVDDAGTKRTVISLSKPDGWAKGRYSIEIAINGKVERTVTFDVP